MSAFSFGCVCPCRAIVLARRGAPCCKRSSMFALCGTGSKFTPAWSAYTSTSGGNASHTAVTCGLLSRRVPSP